MLTTTDGKRRCPKFLALLEAARKENKPAPAKASGA
jgi:hypothetical protein